MEASGNGRTAVVKILVNRGADKDKKNTVCHCSLVIHHCRVYYVHANSRKGNLLSTKQAFMDTTM